jgi:hypothetical protein
VHYGRGANEADSVVADIRTAGGHADSVTADLAAPDGAHLLAEQVRAVVGDRLLLLTNSPLGVGMSARSDPSELRCLRYPG